MRWMRSERLATTTNAHHLDRRMSALIRLMKSIAEWTLQLGWRLCSQQVRRTLNLSTGGEVARKHPLI